MYVRYKLQISRELHARDNEYGVSFLLYFSLGEMHPSVRFTSKYKSEILYKQGFERHIFKKIAVKIINVNETGESRCK